MLKRSLQVYILILFMLVACTSVFAAIPAPTSKAINDFAGILKDTSGIESSIAKFKGSNPAIDITIMTIASTEGLTIEQYARDVIAKWGGLRILLLIAVKEGEARLAVSPSLSSVMTAQLIDQILEESKQYKGTKRVEYIVNRVVSLHFLAPTAPAPAAKPATKAVDNTPAYPTKSVPSKPMNPIWYVVILLGILAAITVPIILSNNKRRKICSEAHTRCVKDFDALRSRYTTAIESLTRLMEKYPQHMDPSYTSIMDANLDNFEVQIGAAKRKCSAFIVSSSLSAEIDSLRQAVNDVKSICQQISNREAEIDTCRDNVINLYTNIIPKSIEGIKAELEKGVAYETIRTDFQSIEAEFQVIQLAVSPESVDWHKMDMDKLSKTIDWISMGQKLSSIARSLEAVKRQFEHRKQEFKEAEKRATKYFDDMPTRLAQAEAKATTEKARRKVAEARAEYEDALRMRSSTNSDLVNWMILDSMLDHSHHTVQTVYVQQPVHQEQQSYGRNTEWRDQNEVQPAPGKTTEWRDEEKVPGGTSKWGQEEVKAQPRVEVQDDEPVGKTSSWDSTEETTGSTTSWSDEE